MSHPHSHSSSTANRTQLGYEDQSYQIVGAGKDAQVVRTIGQAGGDLTQQVHVRDTTFGVPGSTVQKMLDTILVSGSTALNRIEKQNHAALTALASAHQLAGSAAAAPAKTKTTLAKVSHLAKTATPWLVAGAVSWWPSP